jgi:hypothetical protein
MKVLLLLQSFALTLNVAFLIAFAIVVNERHATEKRCAPATRVEVTT